jgi:hypothetical protein
LKVGEVGDLDEDVTHLLYDGPVFSKRESCVSGVVGCVGLLGVGISFLDLEVSKIFGRNLEIKPRSAGRQAHMIATESSKNVQITACELSS